MIVAAAAPDSHFGSIHRRGSGHAVSFGDVLGRSQSSRGYATDPTHPDHLISLGKWTAIARGLIQNRAYEEYSSDIQFQRAVSEAVEMVGEISGRLSRRWPQWAAEHPRLELASAYALRNRLAHAYDGADLGTIWRTVTMSVPVMDAIVHSLLDEFGPRDA